jgi:biopolymer transport protein ExbB
MYPILVCSVLAVAVIVERTAHFILTREDAHALRTLVEDLLTLARRSGQTELEIRSSPSYQKIVAGKGPFSSMALCFIHRREGSREELEEAIFNVGRRGMEFLQRRLGVLSVVAHLSPLLGLFGTVLGMIEVFQGLQTSADSAEVAALSGGIWVALLTTAFGMAVAIPASAAYHLFEGIIGRREAKLQDFVEELSGLFGRNASNGSFAKDAAEGPDEIL